MTAGVAAAAGGAAAAAAGSRAPDSKPAPTPALMAGSRPPTARPVNLSPQPPKPDAEAEPVDPTLSPAEALDSAKLYAARRLAVSTCPYLAVALHAMSIVPTYAVPTMAVDRYWRCYVSPAFVAATAMRELAAVWLHEVSHLVREHDKRGLAVLAASARHEAVGGAGTAVLDPANPARSHLLLNIAMDLEINDDLLEGISQQGAQAMPDDGVSPRLTKGALTPASLSLGRRRDLFEQYLRDLTPSHVERLWTDCGSGAHGDPMPWELGPDGAAPLTDREAGSIRIAVRDAVQKRGTAPAGWQRWAEKFHEPPQDWRRLLGAAFRTSIGAAAGAVDYTYRRPGRRTAALGGQVVMPSLQRPLPQVAVVIDTSGSVTDLELGSALSELAAIARAVGVGGNQVAVYSCDAAAGTAQQVCGAEDLKLVGGGGTDLRTGIAKAMAAARPPDVVVVLTDGITPWPAADVGARVICGLFGSRRLTYHDDHGNFVDLRPPAWVEVVHLA